MSEAFEKAGEWLTAVGGDYPVVLFMALVILPGLGVPASPLLLFAGAVWGSEPATCLLALCAIALNIVWTHCFAAGPGHKFLSKLLGNRWRHWQSMPKSDLLRLTLVLRITPGVPLVVQNYVLGLLRVPLRHSLLIALPLTGLYTCGFVLTGGAMFEGRLGGVLTGVCILAGAAVFLHFLRAKFGVRAGS